MSLRESKQKKTRFRTLAVSLLLATLGVATPAQAEVYCWQTDGPMYCTDEVNEWRDYLHSNINQLYREVLGRDVDPSGLRTYTNRLDNGKSFEWVRASLAKSNEAKEKINLVYQEVLRRDADKSGFKTYSSNLKHGWTLQRVREDISRSEEARRLRLVTRNV